MSCPVTHPAHWNNPVRQAQQTFRSLLRALSRPCRPVPLPLPEGTAAPLAPELAAIALTLCDQDTTVWLSPSLNEESVRRWFRFQCGSTMDDDPGRADFAFIAGPEDMPPLSVFSQGSAEYPDRSATLCLGGMMFSQPQGSFSCTGSGPGIRRSLVFQCNLPERFLLQWEENHQSFPQGVDMFLCGEGMASGLPRSTTLKAQEA